MPKNIADNFLKIPLKEIQIPKDNHVCYANLWWVCHENHVLIYTGTENNCYSIQANTLKDIIPSKLHEKLFPGCKAILVKWSYIKQSFCRC